MNTIINHNNLKLEDIHLEKVAYRRLKSTAKSNAFKINYYDEALFNIEENDILDVIYERKLEATGLFKVTISFTVRWHINESIVIGFDEKIGQLTDEEKDFLCYSAPNESSLLISQLFKANNIMPYVSPPMYSPKSKN